MPTTVSKQTIIDSPGSRKGSSLFLELPEAQIFFGIGKEQKYIYCHRCQTACDSQLSECANGVQDRRKLFPFHFDIMIAFLVGKMKWFCQRCLHQVAYVPP